MSTVVMSVVEAEVPSPAVGLGVVIFCWFCESTGGFVPVKGPVPVCGVVVAVGACSWANSCACTAGSGLDTKEKPVEL